MLFAIERVRQILSDLEQLTFTDSFEPPAVFTPCSYGAYDLLEAPSDGWEACPPHQNWGGRDQHRWLRSSITLPASFEGKRAVLRVETGRTGWDATNPQFLAFIDGKVAQGLDVNHKELLLRESAQGGEELQVDLYAYSGMQESDASLKLTVAVLQTQIERLYYNLQVPLQVCGLLDEEDYRRVGILNHLNEAVNRLDLRQPLNGAFFASVDEANRYLDTEFYGRFCRDGEVHELCVGHTHIDVAWLWTLAQTREKAVRSFATVVSLMKQYPDYIFMSSQPQLYEYVKEDRPELYKEIKELIRAGRWEAEGAMWLEADCNLISGESMVRQILFGKRFFRDEFGVESKVLWLPDVFGYSAALPQILKKSGVDYFVTSKISWNEFNKLPYDTFRWQGLDGTEIFTHFITTQDYVKGPAPINTTYVGDTTPSHVKGCWHRYQQKEINDTVLNCYGYGDGGGGPTRQMLERLSRLNKGIPGCPQTKSGTALGYLRELEQRVSGNKRLPKWVGELYLEFHRGTYTSMARNKKYNRKTELLNLENELFSGMNTLLCGAAYPQEALERCWKTTLLNQFHDIIPGSSIKQVYEDSKAQYEAVRREGEALLDGALRGIAAGVSAAETSAVVFNPLGFARGGLVSVALPQGWRAARVFDGETPLVSQPDGDGKLLFFAEDVPSKGYKTFTLRQAERPEQGAAPLAAAPDGMENAFFRIRLAPDGTLTSVFDKRAGREVLLPGTRGNQLLAFEDKPHEYYAWNIDIYYQEKMWTLDGAADIEVAEAGPLRAALRVRRRFLDSTIEQIYTIYRDVPRIDFATEIGWHEKQILLKAAFPVDVHTDHAAYDIQYGNVERPTHWNTSWDWARFEVCAHKWADLSEEGYGVSLLNDCKYGHDIRDSVMRLTLLKSPIYPNEDADREHHSFVYSLYPHTGGWRQAETARLAYALNSPLHACVVGPQSGALPGAFSLVQADAGNAMIEAVKQAEDGGALIVRLYEYKNRRAQVRLRFGRPVAAAQACDLMENAEQTLDTQPDGFSFTLRPYEIRTFRVTFAPEA